MLAILVSSPVEKEGMELAAKIGKLLKESGADIYGDPLRVIGPAAASIGKIQDVYRFMVYIKHMDKRKLIEAKNAIEAFLEERQEKGKTGKETVQFDFDPLRSY